MHFQIFPKTFYRVSPVLLVNSYLEVKDDDAFRVFSELYNYHQLKIINNYLLDGMKVVGELFATGEMQLPFVLQSLLLS